MQLGWVDFSREDRDTVLDVISLLKKPDTVDQIGIAQVRDAFADLFFPGTSTIQTIAKYFLIVPYVLKEATEGRYGTNPAQLLRVRIPKDDPGGTDRGQHSGYLFLTESDILHIDKRERSLTKQKQEGWRK